MSDLQQIIASETVNTLKARYLIYFGARPKQLRKSFLTESLAEGFSDQDRLKQYLYNLSDLERTFLQESAFNYGGCMDRERFKLKYGQVPEKPSKGGWYDRQELAEGVSVFFFMEGANWGGGIRKFLKQSLARCSSCLESPPPTY